VASTITRQTHTKLNKSKDHVATLFNIDIRYFKVTFPKPSVENEIQQTINMQEGNAYMINSRISINYVHTFLHVV
jgi:hypothetical protein